MGIHTTDEKKEKISKRKWIKNVGKSTKDLFIDWLSEQELFRFVDGELKLIKEDKERRKRTPKEKKTLKQKVSQMGRNFLDSFIEDYNKKYDTDIKETINKSFNQFMDIARTGEYYKKEKDEFSDMDSLLDDLDDNWDNESSSYGESFFLGEMIDEEIDNYLALFFGYNFTLIDEIKEKGVINKTGDALIVYRHIRFGDYYKIPISFVIKNNKTKLSEIQKKLWTKYHNKMETIVKSSLPSALQYVEREVGRGASKEITEVEVKGIVIERDGKVEVCFSMKFESYDEVVFTMSTYTNVRGSAENYSELGGRVVKESILELRNRLVSELKLTTQGEGSSLVGPIPQIGTKINEIKSDVVDYLIDADNVTKDIFTSNIKLKNTKAQIMSSLKSLIETIANSDKSVTDIYKESMANTIVSLFAIDTEYNLRDIYENPNKDVLTPLDNDVKEIYDSSPEIGKEVFKKIEPIKQSIEEEKSKLTFSPVEVNDEDEANNDVANIDDPEKVPSSASARGEADTSVFGLDINVIKGSESIIKSAATAIGLLGGVAFAIKSLMVGRKNDDFEKKFGSSLTIKEPLIATDDLSKSIISTYSKYVETSNAIEYKKALESSISTRDRGNLLQRAKTALPNTATKANLNIEGKKNLEASDIDETLSAFYQSYFPFMESLGLIGLRNKEEMSFIQNTQCVGSFGEAGEFVNDNRHSPTTVINVEIMYKDTKDLLKIGGENITKKASLTIDVAGRRLRQEDVLKTLLEMNENYFNSIKVTNEEKNTAKRAKFGLNLFKRKGTKEEKKVLSSNTFSDIVNKIDKVKTPLFHLAISLESYHILKDKGLDLRDPKDYTRVMKELPLISLAIIDEDSEIVSISQGLHAMFRDVQFDQLEGEISKYEKELQAILKYGAQR